MNKIHQKTLGQLAPERTQKQFSSPVQSFLHRLNLIFENVISSKRTVRYVGAIILFGLLIRLMWAFATPAIPFYDYKDYHSLASRMANGLGFTTSIGPTAFRPPGYSLVLAVVYRLFGDAPIIGRILNVCLGGATILLTYLLVKRTFSERIAIIAAAIIACTPSLILYSGLLASENVAIPAFLAGMILFYDGLQTQRWRYVILAGVCLGFASLTRSVFLIVPLFYGLYMLRRHHNVWQGVLMTVAMTVTMLSVVAPWTVRNYVTFGRFIPISTNTGFNLLISFNERSTGEYVSFLIDDVFDSIYDWNTYTLVHYDWDEVEINDRSNALAVEYIREHPWESLMLAPRKLYLMFRDDVSAARANYQLPSRAFYHWEWQLLMVVAQGYYVGLMALAAGFVFVGRNIVDRWRVGFILVPVAAFIALHMVFFGNDRFHLPLLPIFAAFSAFTADALYTKARNYLR